MFFFNIPNLSVSVDPGAQDKEESVSGAKGNKDQRARGWELGGNRLKKKEEKRWKGWGRNFLCIRFQLEILDFVKEMRFFLKGLVCLHILGCGNHYEGGVLGCSLAFFHGSFIL